MVKSGWAVAYRYFSKDYIDDAKFAENNNKGDIITSQIKSITDFGIFVGLDGGIDGLIHITDITSEDKQEEVIRSYKKGDDVKSIILSVDSERERVSLGIKQLQDNKDS